MCHIFVERGHGRSVNLQVYSEGKDENIEHETSRERHAAGSKEKYEIRSCGI